MPEPPQQPTPQRRRPGGGQGRAGGRAATVLLPTWHQGLKRRRVWAKLPQGAFTVGGSARSPPHLALKAAVYGSCGARKSSS